MQCIYQFRALISLSRVSSSFERIWGFFRLPQIEHLKTTARKKSNLIHCTSLASPLINQPFPLKQLKPGLHSLNFILTDFQLTGKNKWMRPQELKNVAYPQVILQMAKLFT